MTPEVINHLDIFSTLSTREMSRVRLLMKRCRVGAGWVLFREGDVGRDMYIILEGSVAISIRTSDDREVEVSRVGEGSFFGEMSILQRDVRSATCRTVEDCEFLSLDAEGFRSLLEREPVAAGKIMQRMLDTATDRLRRTGAFLSDMVAWGEGARIRAITDDFTGFYNRRFFDEALGRAFADSVRTASPLALAFVDLDRFGTLNAEYGEEVGDRVIKAAAQVFSRTFESSDILSRYGGDEFAFLLPGRDGQDALELCRLAGEGIRELDVLGEPKGSVRKVTTSIGIAVYPDHASTKEELLERADQALYSVKEAGRDGAGLYYPGGKR